MPTPSAAYYATIEPARGDRLIVLGSGTLLALVGILPILTLDLTAALRGFAALAWLLFSGRELLRTASAFRQAAGFRLDEALFLEVKNQANNWQAAELAGGSIVLDRAVWLRYRNSDGEFCAELFTGNGRSMHDFRRLKVLLFHAEEDRKR